MKCECREIGSNIPLDLPGLQEVTQETFARGKNKMEPSVESLRKGLNSLPQELWDQIYGEVFTAPRGIRDFSDNVAVRRDLNPMQVSRSTREQYEATYYDAEFEFSADIDGFLEWFLLATGAEAEHIPCRTGMLKKIHSVNVLWPPRKPAPVENFMKDHLAHIGDWLRAHLDGVVSKKRAGNFAAKVVGVHNNVEYSTEAKGWTLADWFPSGF